MAKPAHFLVYQDTAGEWRWHLKAKNGRVIADSAEGYKSKQGAERSVLNLAEAFGWIGALETLEQFDMLRYAAKPVESEGPAEELEPEPEPHEAA